MYQKLATLPEIKKTYSIEYDRNGDWWFPDLLQTIIETGLLDDQLRKTKHIHLKLHYNDWDIFGNINQDNRSFYGFKFALYTDSTAKQGELVLTLPEIEYLTNEDA